MNGLVQPGLATWEVAMDKLRESERRLEAAMRTRNAHAAWAAHDEVDRVAMEAALLLASAVEVARALEHKSAKRGCAQPVQSGPEGAAEPERRGS